MLKMFKRCSLFPTYWMTSASYSVASLLLNGRHPVSKKKLFFPYLEEPVFELISQNMLNGGYSVNSSMYNHHNFGYAMHGNTDPDNVSAALYCDYNSLYPSSLQASQFCMSCNKSYLICTILGPITFELLAAILLGRMSVRRSLRQLSRNAFVLPSRDGSQMTYLVCTNMLFNLFHIGIYSVEKFPHTPF